MLKKTTPANLVGHNSKGAQSVAQTELRSYVERLERLDSETADIAHQKKEVMSEAKGRGYDTKIIRRVVALRKRDRDDVAEEEAILDLYLAALGMAHYATVEDDADGQDGLV